MYTTHGILLNSAISGEVDERASIYTADFGKIKVRVRGAKKVQTKQGNYLHTPAVLRFSFVAGKSGHILSGVTNTKNYPALASDLIAQAYVISFFQLCDSLTYDEDPDEKVWSLLNSVLDSAEKASVLGGKDKKEALWKEEKGWLVSLLDIFGLRPSEFDPGKIKTKQELDIYIQNMMQQAFERPIEFFGLKAR